MARMIGEGRCARFFEGTACEVDRFIRRSLPLRMELGMIKLAPSRRKGANSGGRGESAEKLSTINLLGDDPLAYPVRRTE